MALTLRRWIAAAALTCAAVAVAYLPPDPSPALPVWAERAQRRTALSGIEWALRRASSLEAFLNQRDRALSLLRRQPRTARPTVLGGLSGSAASVTEAVAAIVPRDTSIAIAIAVAPNETMTRGGRRIYSNRIWYAFPNATDGRTCLVIVPRAFAGARSPSEIYRILGPCAFYAAFGQPGQGIEAWLHAVNYHPAQEGDWNSPRLPPGRLSIADFSEVTMPQLLGGGAVFATRQGISLAAAGCAAGRPDRCGPALDMNPWYVRFVDQPHSADKPAWPGASSDQSWYFADLVRDRGHERFARFWRSPLPRDSAFAQAYGLSIEDWTQHWLAGRHPDVRVGPAIRLSSVLLGLLFAAGLVAGGAFYTMRRQVG